MFKFKKKKEQEEVRKTEPPDGQLTEIQQRALDKQQEQARALHRLEAEADLLGRRT